MEKKIGKKMKEHVQQILNENIFWNYYKNKK